MLEFVAGPHGEKISLKEQSQLRECLKEGSFCWKLNETYNNYGHFYSHNQYDISSFLNELKYLLEHKYHKVQLMGGVHTDTYGHTTGMIGQYTEYNEYVPSVVKDSYIRFKIYLDPNHMRVLRVFDTFSVFHFLTSAPHIEKLHLGKQYPVYMSAVDASLIPTSNYKGITIGFI